MRIEVEIECSGIEVGIGLEEGCVCVGVRWDFRVEYAPVQRKMSADGPKERNKRKAMTIVAAAAAATQGGRLMAAWGGVLGGGQRVVWRV